MFTRIPKEIREEVTAKAKAGEKVAELAKTYGISTKTIYGWLSKDGGDDSVSVLKYNKLKRENEELKRLLGEVTLALKWGKKGRNGSSLN
jgi:transposase-like protein